MQFKRARARVFFFFTARVGIWKKTRADFFRSQESLHNFLGSREHGNTVCIAEVGQKQFLNPAPCLFSLPAQKMGAREEEEDEKNKEKRRKERKKRRK